MSRVPAQFSGVILIYNLYISMSHSRHKVLKSLISLILTWNLLFHNQD